VHIFTTLTPIDEQFRRQYVTSTTTNNFEFEATKTKHEYHRQSCTPPDTNWLRNLQEATRQGTRALSIP
jgi:hypothetical protein